MHARSIAELVAEHPLFSGMDGDIVDLLSGCARNVAFPEGTLVLREGATTERFYLVRSGRMAVEAVVPGRGRAIVQTLGPGDFAGQDWLVPPYTNDFDVRAGEVVRAVAFDAGCLRGKCEADPRVGYALLKCFVPALVESLKAVRLQSLDLYAAPEPVAVP